MSQLIVKKGKEIKIKSYSDYSVKYGCVDNLAPKAIYINISTWSLPKTDSDINYDRVIKNLNKKIKQLIYDTLDFKNNESFKDRTIVDMDIRESGVRYGKKSFLNCEVTLFLKQEFPVNSEIMRPVLDELTKIIIDGCFENNRYFSFFKTKKDKIVYNM